MMMRVSKRSDDLGSMTRKLTSVATAVVLMLFSTSLAAQLPPPMAEAATSARAAAVTQAKPALWVVKDRDTTIYLFGTVHLMRPGIEWLKGPRKMAFDSAQELVLEIADDPDVETQMRIAQRALDRDGPPLTSKLPEALRARFTALLKENNTPAAVVDRMKPWFAAVTLTQLALARLGYDPANGVDVHLRKAAHAQGKTVTGLETAEEQISLFDGLSEELQVRLLVDTINEYGEVEKSIAEMIDSWSAGDPVALARNLNKSLVDDQGLAQRLLIDRNERWADWIKSRLAKPGTVFLAVGAGHLAGDGSLQGALKTRRLKAKLVKQR
jgi:uncharacterized protein YbaP (TraB family)